ncbi:hypothetical protein Bca101_001243 [Brassica carinata]
MFLETQGTIDLLVVLEKLLLLQHLILRRLLSILSSISGFVRLQSGTNKIISLLTQLVKEQWGHYLRVPFLESVAWRSFLKRMAENNVESDREDPNAVDVKHEAFGE